MTFNPFRAFAGGDTGSIYLQTFAKYLKQFYMRLPLDRIYLLVKQSMVQSVQVKGPLALRNIDTDF